MEYKVVPFVATIHAQKGNSVQVAQQLEDLIASYNEQGWKYIRLESVTTYIQSDSGCFGIGATQGGMTTRQMVVFQK